MTTPASPLSSGPAGSLFEAQIGASYLLAMLVGGEPRGLPGTVFDRIELQRASEGHPLDDIVVHAHDASGTEGTIEVQVKRTITFAPTDPVFKSVVEQMARASQIDGFTDRRHELAVATANVNRKIGSYQDVLTWARQVGSADTFMGRIEHTGSANADMRSFVRTFTEHLNAAGAPIDNKSVWGLLRRFQIHVYDFTSVGSAMEVYARERAAHALHPDDTAKAPVLWDNLTNLATSIAAAAGDRTKERLVSDLNTRGFRLVGERRHLSARSALAEASRLALAAIGSSINGASLGRYERLAQIRAAFGAGRYLEVRGDGGVGKSALLKHFAEAAGTEGRIVVLKPGRITPRGWTAMRSALKFDGTVTDLLTDLAAGGGAYLFIDNLDTYADDERTTVIDLVRAAADVPGIHVIASARTTFGVDEPSWLPSEAIDRLGRCEPVVVGELHKSELEELRHAAPNLRALLADEHPARAVARNLFRLSRLATMRADAATVRTEVEMVDLWWRTADGQIDAGHRDRSRLLRQLANEALQQRRSVFDTISQPAKAVDALCASETLRDLRSERVEFRHDVLKEWAIAGIIAADTSVLTDPLLSKPATPSSARALELAARLKLERDEDPKAWTLLLESVSTAKAHLSWRRAVLLAIVHSESAFDVLNVLADVLLDSDGALLRELIPIVLAVDTQPATELWAALGINIEKVPTNFHAPNGPSWSRLIIWLLSLQDRIPKLAIPEVAELYRAWCVGTLGWDPLTAKIVPQVKNWLVEIEVVRDQGLRRPYSVSFGNFPVDGPRLEQLESDLRVTFCMFCNRAPRLAADYLLGVEKLRRKQDIYEEVLKFHGSLAQAAPAELVKLTLDALVEKDNSERRRTYREALTFTDSQFMPESPARGPFLELLSHAPSNGLELIRQLVGHVVRFHSGGREAAEEDALVVRLGEDTLRFQWLSTYGWSRSSRYHSVTSALMALEAWGHRRIESGEDITTVLADVLGPSGAPAAFVLVAVDLLISHWPKSCEPAIPFLACPKLVAIDRERAALEQFEPLDLFGVRALPKEPLGTEKLEELKSRPSRRFGLDSLLLLVSSKGFENARAKLRSRLEEAAHDLGPPQSEDDLSEPRLVVAYALNLIEPANYVDVQVPQRDGSEATARQYVSPPAEAVHMHALQEKARDKSHAFTIVSRINLAIEAPGNAQHGLIEEAVAWAKKQANQLPDEDEKPLVDSAVLAAAMIAMRDGTPQERAEHRSWATSVFNQQFQSAADVVNRHRSGLRFNPAAMMLCGQIYSLGDGATAEDVRNLLRMVIHDPGAARAAAVAEQALNAIDPRLSRSMLRVALASCRNPLRDWRSSADEHSARKRGRDVRLHDAIEGELTWLVSGTPEPDWPQFPDKFGAKSRRALTAPVGADGREPALRRTEFVDHQAAALWLDALGDQIAKIDRASLRGLLSVYSAWTYASNGAGLESHDEVSDPPHAWNSAYFGFLASSVVGRTEDEAAMLLTPILSLPDRSYFDITTRFLRGLDAVQFNDNAVEGSVALLIRSRIVERLMSSYGWRRLRESKSTGIEMHLGPAVGAVFFNDFAGFGQPPQCYLLEKGVRRSQMFLSLLTKLVVDGPSLFVALVTLNLLDVAAEIEQLPLGLAMAESCLHKYGRDRAFWVDQGIGRRLCDWLDRLRTAFPTAFEPTSEHREQIDRLLAELVGAGIPDARRLESVLQSQ